MERNSWLTMTAGKQITCTGIQVQFQHTTAPGLPGARSEISGPNVYKMSGQFQDIFVGFTRLKTQKEHVFSVLIMLFIEADQYCSPKNVTKTLL